MMATIATFQDGPFRPMPRTRGRRSAKPNSTQPSFYPMHMEPPHAPQEAMPGSGFEASSRARLSQLRAMGQDVLAGMGGHLTSAAPPGDRTSQRQQRYRARGRDVLMEMGQIPVPHDYHHGQEQRPLPPPPDASARMSAPGHRFGGRSGTGPLSTMPVAAPPQQAAPCRSAPTFSTPCRPPPAARDHHRFADPFSSKGESRAILSTKMRCERIPERLYPDDAEHIPIPHRLYSGPHEGPAEEPPPTALAHDEAVEGPAFVRLLGRIGNDRIPSVAYDPTLPMKKAAPDFLTQEPTYISPTASQEGGHIKNFFSYSDDGDDEYNDGEEGRDIYAEQLTDAILGDEA